MAETATTDFNARMYTTHGVKKNQGKWARVNNQVALTYTEGKGDNERVVGYVEQPTAYKRKNRALDRLTVLLFGKS